MSIAAYFPRRSAPTAIIFWITCWVSSQFLGTFRPGDPRLIFGLYGPGN